MRTGMASESFAARRGLESGRKADSAAASISSIEAQLGKLRALVALAEQRVPGVPPECLEAARVIAERVNSCRRMLPHIKPTKANAVEIAQVTTAAQHGEFALEDLGFTPGPGGTLEAFLNDNR